MTLSDYVLMDDYERLYQYLGILRIKLTISINLEHVQRLQWNFGL